MHTDIKAITEAVQRESAFIEPLFLETSKVIVGQKPMLERVLIGLLCNGHVLLEGVPGLAKTLTVRTFADCTLAGARLISSARITFAKIGPLRTAKLDVCWL